MKNSLFVLCFFIAAVAHAGSIDNLHAFVTQTQSARAQFSQLVVDRNGRTVSQTSGTMMFSRPGKFRWIYEKPYEQLLVGDGVKLWIYDK